MFMWRKLAGAARERAAPRGEPCASTHGHECPRKNGLLYLPAKRSSVGPWGNIASPRGVRTPNGTVRFLESRRHASFECGWGGWIDAGGARGGGTDGDAHSDPEPDIRGAESARHPVRYRVRRGRERHCAWSHGWRLGVLHGAR